MSNVAPVKLSLNRVLVELDELKMRLEEAESTIEAIRTGSVDALVVQGEKGEQVFTLRGADEPYRVFVEHMREGAVTLGEGGIILYCNMAFAELLGEPLERVIGTPFFEYFSHESGHEDVISLLTGSARVEGRIKRGAEEVSVLCSSTPVHIDGPATFAVTVTDLTEQKLHEIELEKATAELEGFCYSVSHDMRAPLRSMIGAAHILVEDYGKFVPEEARQDLMRIARSASYLGKLMDDLLQYSRLNREVVRRSTVDLSEMVRRLSERLSEERTDIEWSIEDGIVVEGDPHLLEMVLQNLLSNAVKFSAHSSPAEIAFGRDIETSALYVKDNGIGFDMAYINKLFIPFERLHRQEEYSGTGIGLANVKRVIARHGGLVWATGQPGIGATFFFTLPKPQDS